MLELYIIILALIPLTIIDVHRRIIPNEILLALIVIYFAMQLVSREHSPPIATHWHVRFSEAIIMLIMLWVVSISSKGKFGMGDAKLISILVLYLGIELTLLTMFCAFLLQLLTFIAFEIHSKCQRKVCLQLQVLRNKQKKLADGRMQNIMTNSVKSLPLAPFLLCGLICGIILSMETPLWILAISQLVLDIVIVLFFVILIGIALAILKATRSASTKVDNILTELTDMIEYVKESKVGAFFRFIFTPTAHKAWKKRKKKKKVDAEKVVSF